MTKMPSRPTALAVRAGLVAIVVGLGAALIGGARAQKPDDPPPAGQKPDLKDVKKSFIAPLEGKENVQVRTGRRCATAEPSAAQRQRSRLAAAQIRTALPGVVDPTAFQVEIKVRYIVIHNGADGNVTDERLKKQTDVMNETFKDSGFRFTQLSVERHDVAAGDGSLSWFRMTHMGESERLAKEKWGKDQATTLNFYTAEPLDFLGQPLLGWATFPFELAINPRRDGVVILHSTLPDGESAGFNLGKTATHEVGHWLGLFHTFQGGCAEPGDEVADTPAQSDEADTNGNGVTDIFECIEGLDTCPKKEGKDPVHNYMNYPEDACLREFTKGQITRMREQTAAFRPDLIAGSVPDTLRQKFMQATKQLKR